MAVDDAELFSDEIEEEPGAEDEQDLESLTPEDFQLIRVSSVDWTVGTLLDQIEAAELDIAPSFQRRDAWNATKKSRLIESLILGIPVPQIILATLPDDIESTTRPRLTVLDGKQRLLAIAGFLRPALTDGQALRIRGLRTLTALNGSTFGEAETNSELRDHLYSLRTRTIRTVLVENALDDRILHLIFLRLNTETVRLSPQELRQAEFPGPFTEWLESASAASEALQRALRINGPDFRMRDMEVLLRYFAFHFFLHGYGGNMKKFLDDCLKTINRDLRTGVRTVTEMGSRLSGLESSIDATIEIFEEETAFTSLSLTGFERRFNRAVFDVMTYFFSDETIRQQALARASAVRSAFAALTEDSKFAPWIQTTTKSKRATFGRFRRWGEALSEVLGSDVFDRRPVPLFSS